MVYIEFQYKLIPLFQFDFNQQYLRFVEYVLSIKLAASVGVC